MLFPLLTCVILLVLNMQPAVCRNQPLMASSAPTSLGSTIPAAGLVPAQRSLDLERGRAKSILKQVSETIEKHFYDPTLHGLDWEALTNAARQRIEQSDSVNEMYGAIFSLADKLQDSHTVFVPPERAAQPQFGFEAKAFGPVIRIYKLDKQGPAAQAGLLLGDRILDINGFRAERNTFDVMMLYLRLLRPVTALDITFSRELRDQQKVRVQADLTQATLLTDLTDQDTIYRIIRNAENERAVFRYREDEDGVGFLQLPYFPADKGFLSGLVKGIQTSKAVVVDLRGNPGGAIDGLERMISLFEDESTVVANMIGRKKTEQLKVKPRKPNLRGPLFILVDSQSMSSAEIFARHFERRGRAVLIGDRTFGRATVARIYSHKSGTNRAVLASTQVGVQRFVFPDGEELEGNGILPGIECIPSQEQLEKGADPCRSLAQALASRKLSLPGSYLRLGLAYQMIGKDKQALDTLEEGLGTEPSALLLNSAAWLYATTNETALNNPQKALDYAKRAMELDTQPDTAYLDLLADAFYEIGQFENAIEVIEKAISLESDNQHFREQREKFEAARKEAQVDP